MSLATDTKEEMITKGELKITHSNFRLMITNYQDNAELFYKEQPYFYDRNQIFWFWNKNQSKWEIVDETDIMNLFDKILGFEGQTISKGLKGNYLEAFKRVGRLHIPKIAPVRWIQFKDKAFSLRSGNVYEVTPDYFFTNPIPHAIGETSECPIIDKLFTEWVGEETKQSLYEIIAYCCYQSYPIQTLFCLMGIGRNGKTQFLKLLNKFLGSYNVTSTEFDRLFGINSSRFESFKFYKKLACMMGETNFGLLNQSSMLKKLTGGDLIGYEIKNKMPFDDYNYAKVIIASNSLPSSPDTSEGFYRRWMIIDFPNEFNEGKDIIDIIPNEEYEALAKKVIEVLPQLLDRGCFTNQGTIPERRVKYIMASNPLPMFMKEACEYDPTGFIRYSELYTAYVAFLSRNKKRIVSKKEFSDMLDIEGIEVRKTNKEINGVYVSDRYIEGYRLNFGFVTDVTHVRTFPYSLPSHESRGWKQSKCVTCVTNEYTNNTTNEVIEDTVIPIYDKNNNIYLPCCICGSNPCNEYNRKYYCEECLKKLTEEHNQKQP